MFLDALCEIENTLIKADSLIDISGTVIKRKVPTLPVTRTCSDWGRYFIAIKCLLIGGVHKPSIEYKLRYGGAYLRP